MRTTRGDGPGAPGAAEQQGRMPDGLWEKCPKCERAIFRRDLEKNLRVCTNCGYHFRLPAYERIALLTEPGSFSEWDADITACDPLGFPGYKEKLERDRGRTGLNDAVVTGGARIGRFDVAIGVTDFRFLAGAMNSVVGERITRCIEGATAKRIPLVLVSGTGGGASMYEGILSLMQMPKTAAALARHHRAKLLYVGILTDASMAGVLASWGSLGDVILAEPGASIGFTGDRVSKQASVGKKPPDFQTAEFQLRNGMVDAVVQRKDLKTVLLKILSWAHGEERSWEGQV
ncbi:MAG: acetyl-CoA carboxylase carboxyltransferase subunit beta [Armatimonadota bacterium]